ncbi:helix-turn-helix domain-containing protein [Vibrio alfacsensis]|uniref:helix-turn-helix domain-containing protein n=1 Tax=Vibrio alfacsensis TaxID=1074311 RepID=UPI0040697ABD
MTHSAMTLPQVRLTEKTAPESELIQVWSKRKLLELDKNGALFHPHRIDFSVLLFVTSQTASHEVDGKIIALNRGDILLFGKQSVHRFIQESEWEGIVITVSDNYWCNDLSPKHAHCIESLFLHCTFVEQNSTYSQMLKLVETLSCRTQIQLPVIKHLLVSLLLLIAEKKQAAQTMPGNRVYSAFLELLKSDGALLSINEIAKALSVSMYKLRRACIECSGETPKQLRDEHILIEAIRLLKYSEWPISHISEQLGFGEATYFSKFIKAKTNLTPIEIRREWNSVQFFHQT